MKANVKYLENLIKRTDKFKGLAWLDWRFKARVGLKSVLPAAYRLVEEAERHPRKPTLSIQPIG